MAKEFSSWLKDESTKVCVGTRPFVEIPALEPGYYDLSYNRMSGAPVVTPIEQKKDSHCFFQSGPLDNVLSEIGAFWSGDEAYKELGMTHKRSILLYGPPGCGKTGILTSVIADVVKRNGIAITFNTINVFHQAIPLFRQIQPDTPVVVVTEDVENKIAYDEPLFLEVLDGSSSIGGNVLYLSTTNNLNAIPERIRCRPSRMDTLIEIGAPCKEQRAEYVEFILGKIKGASKPYKAEIVEKSDGFSLADLKELIVSTYVYKKTVADSVERIGSVKCNLSDKKGDDEDDDDYDDDN